MRRRRVRESLRAKQPDEYGDGSDWNGDHYTDHQQFNGAGHKSEWKDHAVTIPAAASLLQTCDFVGDVWLPDVRSINLDD